MDKMKRSSKTVGREGSSKKKKCNTKPSTENIDASLGVQVQEFAQTSTNEKTTSSRLLSTTNPIGLDATGGNDGFLAPAARARESVRDLQQQLLGLAQTQDSLLPSTMQPVRHIQTSSKKRSYLSMSHQQSQSQSLVPPARESSSPSFAKPANKKQSKKTLAKKIPDNKKTSVNKPSKKTKTPVTAIDGHDRHRGLQGGDAPPFLPIETALQPSQRPTTNSTRSFGYSDENNVSSSTSTGINERNLLQTRDPELNVMLQRARYPYLFPNNNNILRSSRLNGYQPQTNPGPHYTGPSQARMFNQQAVPAGSPSGINLRGLNTTQPPPQTNMSSPGFGPLLHAAPSLENRSAVSSNDSGERSAPRASNPYDVNHVLGTTELRGLRHDVADTTNATYGNMDVIPGAVGVAPVGSLYDLVDRDFGVYGSDGHRVVIVSSAAALWQPIPVQSQYQPISVESPHQLPPLESPSLPDYDESQYEPIPVEGAYQPNSA